MKIRYIAAFASLALFMQTASANITLMSLMAVNNTCSSLTGTWAGSGILVSSYATCQYTGTVTVVPGNEPLTYLAETVLTTTTGGICPNEVDLKMSGSCKNNQVVLQTVDGSMYDTNLTGTINADGKSANLSGTAYVTVFYNRIKAELQSVHLEKVEA
jgi:hypothetical protein